MEISLSIIRKSLFCPYYGNDLAYIDPMGEIAHAGQAFGRGGFYGAGKAVGAVRDSVRSAGKSGREAISNRRAGFYVTPSGDVVPFAGYRYSARNTTIIQNAKNGFIEARSDGMYFSFDTLNIIDDINVPKGRWGTAGYLEPITKDFRNFWPGGATQIVTYSKVNSIMEIFKLR